MKNFFSAQNLAVLALTTCLVSAVPGGAYAAAVSDAGAPDVKKQIEDALAFPLNLEKLTGGGLSMSAPVEVAAKGDFYEAKLTGLSFAQTEMGLKADIGTIVMDITPGDQGEYKVSITLPSSMTVTDDRAAPVADVTVGSQHFTGTWWPKYHAFTQIEAAYGDLKLQSKKADQPLVAEVASFKDTLTLVPDGDIWTGPSKFEVSKVHVSAGGRNEFALTADRIAGQADYTKLNLATYRQVDDKTAQVLVDAQKNKQPDTDQSQALISSLMSSLQTYVDGMGTSMAISDLSLNVSPLAAAGGGKPGKPFSLHVATVTSAMALGGLQQEKGSLSMALGLEGLNVQDTDEFVAGVIPTSSNIDIHVDNVPLQNLAKQFSGLFAQILNSTLASAGAGDPTQKSALQQQLQAQLTAAMASVPLQLTAAGTKLTVANTYTKAPDVSSSLEGSFTANAASPVMATGSLTLLLTGIDELLLKLQALSQAPNADPRSGSWYQGLGIMQMMGKLGKAADGRSQRSYKLEVTPEGRTLLNGGDFFQSMGGGMGMPGGMGAPGGGMGAPGAAPGGPGDAEAPKQKPHVPAGP